MLHSSASHVRVQATTNESFSLNPFDSGYPLGLAGADIPLEGRITAVADVFDALSTQRPYKPAFPLDQCFSLMQEARGSHFDPAILDAFMARRDAIVAVQIAYADLG